MVILATAGQRHKAPMLGRLLETGAVKRPGRGRPRLRPGAVAIGEGGLDVEADDQRLLEKGSFVYDALYAWCQRHADQPVSA
jgi:hypothetical protein